MGKETHEPGKDGLLKDGIDNYPADSHDMATYEAAMAALRKMPAPKLHHATSAHERMFVAAFDGTWSDATSNPEHMTNVGGISEQLQALSIDSSRGIEARYVEGVGTQGNWLTRTLDGAIGYTYDNRVERMYTQLVARAASWLQEDPRADIRIVGFGFSRGAEQVASFARLVHDRGIQDPAGIEHTIDEHGRRIIEYTKPPLVPPGQIAQAVGLFDPVGTGEPRNHDRRLPPSVISGFQIMAEDERRGLFKSTSLIDQGITVDGRFLGATVAGAHGDVGGGYHRNGLSIRAGNLMVDYLNALSDTPLLHKQPEPAMPGMNVVHRSEESRLLFRAWRKIDRLDDDGVVERLAPRSVCKVVVDCRNAEPRDEALAARFDYAPVRIGPAPPDTTHLNPPIHADATSPSHPDHALLLQAMSGVSDLEARLHRPRDLNTDRLAASAMVAAKQAGLERIDHVVLSDKGEHAFAVQGDLDSPLKRYASIQTGTAIHTPVGESLHRIDVINEEIAQERPHQQAASRQAMPSLLREPETTQAPVMSR